MTTGDAYASPTGKRGEREGDRGEAHFQSGRGVIARALDILPTAN